jgi:HupE / UreJ protein
VTNRVLGGAARSLLVAAAALAPLAQAHEFKLDAVINAFVKIEPGRAELVVRAPLYLFKQAKFPVAGVEIDIDQSAPALGRSLAAIQKDITVYENDRPLVASDAAGRLSLPSDRAFESYEQALRHVGEPLERDTHIFIDQGYVDARISYPIGSTSSEFAIRTTAGPELGDALKLALRYLPPASNGRALVVTSSAGVVALNPTWQRAAGGFTRLGIEHILTGYDHLLFLLCLIVPLRGWRQVLSVVTVFTIAHSFTLLGSAFHLAPSGSWFPPFVETAIAASIVYMALENIVGVRLERRILVTALFGLVHGFGFSYGLSENFQFAGTHLLVSLFAFNLGIELGQLLVLALMLPLLAVVRGHLLRGRVGMIILSALVAHTGWHWMIDRGELLWRAPWPRPGVFDLAVFALWLGLAVLAAGALGVVVKRFGLALGAAPPAAGAAAD